MLQQYKKKKKIHHISKVMLEDFLFIYLMYFKTITSYFNKEGGKSVVPWQLDKNPH